VRDVLQAWNCDDPDDIAALLTSEAVTNAVVHAATRLELEVKFDTEAELLRVEVRDGDPTPPVVRHPPKTDVGGRGMALIEVLARRWGTDPTDTGKVVWFELDVPVNAD
jgi:anti-sigma regulatory factor (Ser/Thr protein kinase)